MIDSLISLGTILQKTKGLTILADRSKQDTKLLYKKIGSGKKSILVFGYPHANEPLGSLVCLELIEIIKNSIFLQEQFTWHIIPCADPQGADMNKSWIKKGFTIKDYALGSYRAKMSCQTDWSFPVSYQDHKFSSPPQNVKILAELIQKVKPSFVLPLHHSIIGDFSFISSWQISQDLKDDLTLMAHANDILMQKHKAFQNYRTFSDCYEFFKQKEIDFLPYVEHGNNSFGYAKSLNNTCSSIICEVPLFSMHPKEPQTNDSSVFIKSLQDIAQGSNEIARQSPIYEEIKEDISLRYSFFVDSLSNPRSEMHSISCRFQIICLLGKYKRILISQDKKHEIDKRIDYLISCIQKNAKIKRIPVSDLIRFQIKAIFMSLQENYRLDQEKIKEIIETIA